MENADVTKILVGVCLGLVGVLYKWISGQITKLDNVKLPINVFEEFRKHNDAAHKATHESLKEIQRDLKDHRATEQQRKG